MMKNSRCQCKNCEGVTKFFKILSETMQLKKKKIGESSLVAQWVEDPVLSLKWLGLWV